MTGFKFSAKCDKNVSIVIIYMRSLLSTKFSKLSSPYGIRHLLLKKTLKLISKRVGILFLPLNAIFAGTHSIILAASAFYGQTNASSN